MSYSTSRPNKNNAPATDVQQIQDNFIAIKTSFELNHAAFNLTDEGKHTFVQFPQLTVTGSIPVATSATEYAIYNKTDGVNPALYIRPPSQVAGTITNDINITSSIKTTTGWYRLPCGIIAKWGTGTVTPGATATIALANGSGVPNITTMLSVSVTPCGTITNKGSVYFTSYTSTPGANAIIVSAWSPDIGSNPLTVYAFIMGI